MKQSVVIDLQGATCDLLVLLRLREAFIAQLTKTRLSAGDRAKSIGFPLFDLALIEYYLRLSPDYFGPQIDALIAGSDFLQTYFANYLPLQFCNLNEQLEKLGWKGDAVADNYLTYATALQFDHVQQILQAGKHDKTAGLFTVLPDLMASDLYMLQEVFNVFKKTVRIQIVNHRASLRLRQSFVRLKWNEPKAYEPLPEAELESRLQTMHPLQAEAIDWLCAGLRGVLASLKTSEQLQQFYETTGKRHFSFLRALYMDAEALLLGDAVLRSWSGSSCGSSWPKFVASLHLQQSYIHAALDARELAYEAALMAIRHSKNEAGWPHDEQLLLAAVVQALACLPAGRTAQQDARFKHCLYELRLFDHSQLNAYSGNPKLSYYIAEGHEKHLQRKEFDHFLQVGSRRARLESLLAADQQINGWLRFAVLHEYTAWLAVLPANRDFTSPSSLHNVKMDWQPLQQMVETHGSHVDRLLQQLVTDNYFLRKLDFAQPSTSHELLRLFDMFNDGYFQFFWDRSAYLLDMLDCQLQRFEEQHGPAESSLLACKEGLIERLFASSNDELTARLATRLFASLLDELQKKVASDDIQLQKYVKWYINQLTGSDSADNLYDRHRFYNRYLANADRQLCLRVIELYFYQVMKDLDVGWQLSSYHNDDDYIEGKEYFLKEHAKFVKELMFKEYLFEPDRELLFATLVRLFDTQLQFDGRGRDGVLTIGYCMAWFEKYRLSEWAGRLLLNLKEKITVVAWQKLYRRFLHILIADVGRFPNGQTVQSDIVDQLIDASFPKTGE